MSMKNEKITKLSAAGGPVVFQHTDTEVWITSQAMGLHMSCDECVDKLRAAGSAYLKHGDLSISDEELRNLVMQGKLVIK